MNANVPAENLLEAKANAIPEKNYTPCSNTKQSKQYLDLFQLSAALTAQYGFLELSDIQSISPLIPKKRTV